MAAADPPLLQSASPSPQRQDLSRTTADMKKASNEEAQYAATIVAPMLAEALANDGRGAFGCVAVDPPVFFSEAEAIEIIFKELRAAGLELEHSVMMKGMQVPNATPASPFPAETKTEQAKDKDEFIIHFSTPEPVRPGEFVVDLADTKRSVYIEYLTKEDFITWMGRGMGSGWSCDLPATAHKVTEAFEKRKSNDKAVVGVFFDPLTKRGAHYWPDLTGLNAEQIGMVYSEHRKTMDPTGQDLVAISKRKLQKQVQYFIDYLRQKGVIAKTSSQSSQANTQP
jgi:hypothetical protein